MVNTSLFTGLSGMRAHQRYIDVIGNNLANVSTPGYWGARATFSDVLSFTLHPGAGPGNNFGGTNPMQVGLGASLASIDLRTDQGTFLETGRNLDVALQGRGFFTLTNGQQSFYTRVGTFGVDNDRVLVDVRTGLRVVSATGSPITVPTSDTLSPRSTSTVEFQGSLPAQVSGPLEEIVESSLPFLEGTAATKATGSGPWDLTNFVGRTLLVTVNGGAAQTVSFPASAFANVAAVTPAELAARFDNVTGLTATVSGNTVSFASVKLGKDAGLKFDDGSGANGLLSTLGLNAALATGTQVPAAATTDLAQLTARNSAYQDGDRITVSGTNPDGSPVSDTFVYGIDGTTVGDLIAFVNATFDDNAATASIDTNGNLRLTALQKGPANLSMFIGDATGNVGSSNFPSFKLLQDGKGPDTATTSIDVVDSLGRTHPVTMTFTRTTADPNVWDLRASMDPTEGTITGDTVSTIRFNNDGSFNVIGGGTNSFVFNFAGIASSQSVAVNLGTSGGFQGVTMLGDKTTVAATNQDGYGAGSLLNVAFDQEGRLVGYYTNGQTQTLDTLRISMFPNDGGLLRSGDTLFIESPNSDDAIATTAGAAGAGFVRAGALENSNVDIAAEFVNLITAQRGFQANSRVITTTDEILAELVNIVR